MFSSLGKIKNNTTYKNIILPINELNQGVNLFDDYFVHKKNNEIKIFDRTCDHAGGKLIHRDNKIICPMHDWEFLPLKRCYRNGVKKIL